MGNTRRWSWQFLPHVAGVHDVLSKYKYLAFSHVLISFSSPTQTLVDCSCKSCTLRLAADSLADSERNFVGTPVCGSYQCCSVGPEASTPTSSRRRRREDTPSEDERPSSQRLRLSEPKTPLESGRQCNWCGRSSPATRRLLARDASIVPA